MLSHGNCFALWRFYIWLRINKTKLTLTLILQLSHIMYVSVCYSCLCVCVECYLAVAPTCVMDRGRERRAHVSPWQPTCLWPFIKPGGVEEREGLIVTDRALCGTRGGPCCLLTQTAPPCAASERSQHADSVRGYATKSISIAFLFSFFFFFFSCAFHTETSRLGKAAGCHANGRHSAPQPTKSDSTPQTHTGHAPASVRLDQTQSDSNQTESEAEHIGSVRVEEGQPAAGSTSGSYCIYSTILKMEREDAGRIYVSDVKDWTNFPL